MRGPKHCWGWRSRAWGRRRFSCAGRVAGPAVAGGRNSRDLGSSRSSRVSGTAASSARERLGVRRKSSVGGMAVLVAGGVGGYAFCRYKSMACLRMYAGISMRWRRSEGSLPQGCSGRHPSRSSGVLRTHTALRSPSAIWCVKTGGTTPNLGLE